MIIKLNINDILHEKLKMMKEAFSYQKMKLHRIQEASQHNTRLEPSSSFLMKFNSNFSLTEEQIKNTKEILDDLISDDEQRIVQGLKDLKNQILVLGSKILYFLDLSHITKLMELMKNIELSDCSLTIIANIRGMPELSNFLLLNNVHETLITFLKSNNQRFITLSILIVGNNCECSTEFRDYAYENGLLKAVYESNTINLKDKIWAISNSLLRVPYPNNLEKEVSTILINCSQQKYYFFENTTISLRGLVLKTFVHMLDEGASDFIDVIVENNFILVLIDEFLTGNEKRKLQTIQILSECCNNEDAVLQMINNDFLPKFREVLSDNKTSEDFLRYGLYLIQNWINLDNYFSYICDIVIMKLDFSIFLKNHSFKLEQNAIKTLQRIVYVILPTDIPTLLSKELVSLLINLAFTNNTSTTSFITLTFYSVFDKCQLMTDFLSQLAHMLLPLIESNDYHEVCETMELKQATQLANKIKEYLE